MSLYQKHRPQLFSSLIGQEHIVQTLTNQIKLGKIGHAYLFCGPRGVGKTTAARLLAKSINCINKKPDNFEPCDECSSCREIATGRAIDVIEIDAASHTGVENVRENIIDNAQFKPTKSPFKIFIIDEVHMLSTSSFNALLKILEEPPTHVIFILATTEAHKILETIISRCQRFDFKKVPFELMHKQLLAITKAENKEIDPEVVERIIAKSDGCVRDAISLLDQLLASNEEKITLELASLILPASNNEDTLSFLTSLIKKDKALALKTLADLDERGTRFNYFADDLIKMLRIIMIQKISPTEKLITAELNPAAKKEINEIITAIEFNDIIALIDLIMKRAEEIDTFPLPRLPLEMAVVEWTERSKEKGERRKEQAGLPTFASGQTTAGEAETSKPDTSKPVTHNMEPVASDTININPVMENKSEVGIPCVTVVEDCVIEKVTDLLSPEQALTIEEVRDKWMKFLERVEKHSTSLVFILKMAEIMAVNSNNIELVVPYHFHADKLQEKSLKLKLEDFLSEVMNKTARFSVLVKEKSAEPSVADVELNNLAAAFGGEVV